MNKGKLNDENVDEPSAQALATNAPTTDLSAPGKTRAEELAELLEMIAANRAMLDKFEIWAKERYKDTSGKELRTASSGAGLETSQCVGAG